MAKRQGFRKIKSDEVMGEGSYVLVRPVVYERTRQVLKMKQADNVPLDEAEEFVAGLVVESLIEWDWVDDDDEPLPIPQTVEEMGEKLYTHEVQFLITNLIGSAEEEKN